jgi:hypothetical protein
MQPTPQNLTTPQQVVLIPVLLAFPDRQVGVCYNPATSNARSFAKYFLTVLKVIGWNVNELAPSVPYSVNMRGGR